MQYEPNLATWLAITGLAILIVNVVLIWGNKKGDWLPRNQVPLCLISIGFLIASAVFKHIAT